MKLNKNKIIVSALALAIGGSLAGSVGSTIAWYQYSTRANVSFLGQATGISGNLQMRFQGQTNESDWKNTLTYAEIADYIANNQGNKDLQPITFGAMTKDAALPAKAYIQPAAGAKAMVNWKQATAKNYATIPLQLRFAKRDGVLVNNKDQENVEKDVYLTKALLQADASNATNENGAKQDMSSALRIHIHAYKSTDEENTKIDKLISKEGGKTATSGKLDLDGDGNPDKKYANDSDEFGFTTSAEPTEILYGDDGVQDTYAASDVAGSHTYVDAEGNSSNETTVPALATGKDSNGDNVLKLTNLTYPNSETSKKIGKVEAGEDAYLNVDITIWVEGWHKLSNHGSPEEFSSIWDAAQYAGSKFNIGLQFAVQED